MGFFDGVKNQASAAGFVKSAAEQPQTQPEIAQAEQRIQTAEQETRDAMLALGQAYYEANRNNEASEYREQVKTIGKSLNHTELLRQYRLSLEGKLRCEKCGAIITSDSAFCNKCGEKITPPDFSEIGVTAPQQEDAPQTAASVCPSCGAPVAPGMRFCEKCGTQVSA